MPGYHGHDQNPELLQREADRIGYPVLIKASAGGGGKGMRLVGKRSETLRASLAVPAREASSTASGNDAVLIEKYALRPRHQRSRCLATRKATASHLFER